VPFSKIICISHYLLILFNIDLFDPTTGRSRPINHKSFLSELFKSLAPLINRRVMHSNTPCRFLHPSPHVRSPQYSQLLLLHYLFSSLLLVLFPHTVEPPSGIKILTGFSF